MKFVYLLAAWVGINSINALAGVSNHETNCAESREIQFSVIGDDLEIRIYDNLGAILVPKSKAQQFVMESEKVARGEVAPYCENISDLREGMISEYAACYSAKEVELQLFGNLAAVSISTSCLKDALSNKK